MKNWCYLCTRDDKSIVNEVTTLHCHLEAYHMVGSVLMLSLSSWILISCRGNTANGWKKTTLNQGYWVILEGARQQQQNLWCEHWIMHDLVEKKIMERIVKYTDQSFRQATIEWLIAMDQVRSIFLTLSYYANNSTCSQYMPLNIQNSKTWSILLRVPQMGWNFQVKSQHEQKSFDCSRTISQVWSHGSM